MDVNAKNYVEKRLLRMFLTEDEVLMGYKDTDQNIFNFVDLCSGVSIVWSTKHEHESVIPLLSLSPLNVLTH